MTMENETTLKHCGDCAFFNQYNTGSTLDLGHCRKKAQNVNIKDEACAEGKTILDFALLYHDKGLCVIPAEYGEKKPAVKWEDYQKERPTREQVTEWFRNRRRNIAIVVGRVSGGLTVLDFEDPFYFYDLFPKREFDNATWNVKTGKGIHTYFLSVEQAQNRKVTDEKGKLVLEVRAENQVVIAPPSRHPSGKYYDFITKDFENIEIQFVEGLEKDLAKKCWRKNLKGFETEAVKQPWFETAEPTKEPYTGEDPFCMGKIREGVEEGWRNEAATRLSAYLLNFKRLTEKKAWKILEDWNKLNKPPLDENELKSVVESVLKGEYSYGCEDGVLQRFCEREGCPLAKRDIFSTETVEQADEILKSPYLEAWTKETFDENIVGEDKNKLTLHYLELSGKRSNPTEKQLIILKGESGGGKTTLANETTKNYKTKKRGRFSEHALDYSDLSKYEILYLQEILGLKKEEEGVSTLRFLSADDQGYTIEVTVRDKETGRYTTAEYRIPPITVVVTTTMVEIFPQLERRAWTLNVDESDTQTEKVLIHKANKEPERFEQLMELKQASKKSEILRCILARLEDGEVVVPFSYALKEIFRKGILRARGDYDKVLTLVKMRAWWHQKQRPYFTSPKGKKIWVGLPHDGKRAIELAEEPLTGMLTELEKRLRDIIPHVQELADQVAVVIGKDELVYGVTAKNLAQRIGKAQRTARDYLNALVGRGVLGVEKPKGNINVYNFIIPESEIEKKVGISAINDFSDTLFTKFKEETKTFLDKYRQYGSLRMGDKELGERDTEQIIGPIQELPFRRYPSEQEAKPDGEKNPEVSAKPENTDTSKVSVKAPNNGGED